MRIAIWKTGHEIADTVAEAVYEGLKFNNCIVSLHNTSELSEALIAAAEVHIAYGILRGCADVFRSAERCGKNYIELDRGYWKPNHYDGYYRISLNGTQQTFGLDKFKPDYERWDKLGLEILSATLRPRHAIICPPTDHVADFFKIDMRCWDSYEAGIPENYTVRKKQSETPLQNDIDKCDRITTFNSSIGWEALRQGIPVISDPMHSIVGVWQKMLDKQIHNDIEERRKLFSLMASLQLTLEEMRQGMLWPLIKNLLKSI